MSITSITDGAAYLKLKTEFKKAGWSVGNTRIDKADVVGGPTVYICDVDESYVILLNLAKNSFEMIEAEDSQARVPHHDICQAVGHLITEIVNEKTKLDEELANVLSYGITAYINGTESYAKTLELNFPHPQFIIIHQYDHSAKEKVLRPVPLSSPNVLRPDELELFVGKILRMDFEAHPERFKSGKILPFSARNTIKV